MKRAVFAVVFGFAIAASARGTGTMGSVATGRTVGAGHTVFWGQAGFPGLSLKLLHGSSPLMDIGGIFAFDYGVEGSTAVIEPELKLAFALRLNLVNHPKFDLGLELDPGFAVYFAGDAHPGPSIPVKLVAGIPATRNLNIDFGLDTGVTVFFVDGTGIAVPILFGGGVEYYVSSRLDITFNLRMGPLITNGGASFGMNMLIGVALPI